MCARASFFLFVWVCGHQVLRMIGGFDAERGMHVRMYICYVGVWSPLITYDWWI